MAQRKDGATAPSQPTSQPASPTKGPLTEERRKMKMALFLADQLRVGCVKGFKYFRMYLRGREELIVTIRNEQQTRAGPPTPIPDQAQQHQMYLQQQQQQLLQTLAAALEPSSPAQHAMRSNKSDSSLLTMTNAPSSLQGSLLPATALSPLRYSEEATPMQVGSPPSVASPPSERADGVSDTVEDVQPIELAEERYKDHHSPVTLCQVAPSGTLVASSDAAGTIKVWTFASHTTKDTIECGTGLSTFTFGPKDVLYMGFKDGSVTQYTSRGATKSLPFDGAHQSISCLACGPEGVDTLAVGCVSSRNAADFLLLLASTRSFEIQHALHFSAAVSAISFGRDSQTVVVGFTDGMVRVVDVKTANVMAECAAHRGEVRCIRVSADDSSIFSSGTDARLLCLLRNPLRIAWSLNLGTAESKDRPGQYTFALNSSFLFANILAPSKTTPSLFAFTNTRVSSTPVLVFSVKKTVAAGVDWFGDTCFTCYPDEHTVVTNKLFV
eukprot:m.152129 g.152129  ORF g.152129 m.152129 type:complete len:497 (+) comp16913_c0_seq5:281-1771(+)